LQFARSADNLWKDIKLILIIIDLYFLSAYIAEGMDCYFTEIYFSGVTLLTKIAGNTGKLKEKLQLVIAGLKVRKYTQDLK
jgi:hypothetical protein